MKFFKLSALALASTLALTACGDNDDNDNYDSSNPNTGDTPTQPSVDDNLSELEQAKKMIRTAHNFISDSQMVSDVYEDMGDILSDKQSSRLNVSFSLPGDLFDYMIENDKSKLTAADIIALKADEDFNDAIGSYENSLIITPSSDFMATLNDDGQFKMTGTASIYSAEMDYVYDSQTGGGMEIVDEDTFTVVYSDYEDKTNSNTATDDFTGTLAFDSIKVGTGADMVLLEAKDGYKVTGQFSKEVVPHYEFNLDEVHDAGILLEKGVMTLGSLKLTANDSVIEAKDVKFATMDISNELANGDTLIRSVPYQIKLTGQFTKGEPKTDVSLTLNMVADSDDLKNYAVITEDDVVEKDGKFIGMTALLTVKGDVTKENSVDIPLDFQANLKRSARDVLTLEGLTATVDGETLYMTGFSNLDSDYDVTSTKLIIKQNDASVTLNVDENSDFIMDGSGKLADIMVDGKDYGDLMDNNGTITAKFTDDTLITL